MTPASAGSKTMTLSRRDLDFLKWLVVENGYLCPRPLGDGRWAAVMAKAFTHAIVTGRMGDHASISDNWCYQTRGLAEAALDAWDGTGEPGGWFRHPASGRRVSLSADEFGDDGRVGAVGVAYVNL